MIVYVKAYCQCNLGDDLMIRTLVRRYPFIKFYFCVKKENLKAISHENNVRSINPLEHFFYNFNRKIKRQKEYNVENLRIINSSIATVIIGGSLFIEKDNWTYKENYLENIPVFYIGCNFGPYKSEEYFEYKKELIRNSQDICFRDCYSYNLFSNLQNVRLAPDVVWGYPYFPTNNVNSTGIAISVLDFSNRADLLPYKDIYEKGIRDICLYGQKNDLTVKLLSFCSTEGDIDVINRIMRSLQNTDRIEKIYYDGDIDYFLDEINKCNFVIATRFHAMIIGWSLNKKVLPVIYSDKQTYTLKDIGYNSYIWNIKLGQELLLENINQFFDTPKNNLNIDRLKELAQEQFIAFDSFIADL